MQVQFLVTGVTAPTESDPGNEYLDLVMVPGASPSWAPKAPQGAMRICIQDPAQMGKKKIGSYVSLDLNLAPTVAS